MQVDGRWESDVGQVSYLLTATAPSSIMAQSASKTTPSMSLRSKESEMISSPVRISCCGVLASAVCPSAPPLSFHPQPRGKLEGLPIPSSTWVAYRVNDHLGGLGSCD